MLGTPTKIYAYTYGNAWKDQLASYDGSTVTYDDSGNPTSYLGVALTWTRGRLLNTYSKGRTTYTMKYNANGVRTSKVKETPLFNGSKLETTNYTYDSKGRLRGETKANFERIYLYSSDGIIGYEEDGEKFLYRKNLFGDVTAIYQGTDKVAEYVYDAWGNCTITYDPDGYGASNPIRYRGYFWDSDIKMYYLMTRYYDPKIGRFINADSFEYLDPNKINGLNLYAYCGNNPIMYVDFYGHEPISPSIILLGIYILLFAVVAVYILLTSDSNKENETIDNEEAIDKDELSGEKPKFEESVIDILFPPVDINPTDDIVSNISQGLLEFSYKFLGGTGASNIASKMFETEDWLDLYWP